MAQHADLDRGNFYVIQQGIQLRAEFRSGCGMHGYDALGRLDGKSGNGGNAITIVRRESFQISGNTRAR